MVIYKRLGGWGRGPWEKVLSAVILSMATWGGVRVAMVCGIIDVANGGRCEIKGIVETSDGWDRL